MKNEKFNTKGDTNVKSTANMAGNEDQIFDSATADVIRDESKWDAFQLVGDTNTEEMEYVSTPNSSEKEVEKVLDRARAFRVGRKIRMVLEVQTAQGKIRDKELTKS